MFRSFVAINRHVVTYIMYVILSVINKRSSLFLLLFSLVIYCYIVRVHQELKELFHNINDIWSCTIYTLYIVLIDLEAGFGSDMIFLVYSEVTETVKSENILSYTLLVYIDTYCSQWQN